MPKNTTELQIWEAKYPHKVIVRCLHSLLQRDASHWLCAKEEPHNSDIKLKLIRPAGRYLLQRKR